jgi:hypothetical protein
MTQALNLMFAPQNGITVNPAFKQCFVSTTGEMLVKGVVFQGCPFKGAAQAAVVSTIVKTVSVFTPFEPTVRLVDLMHPNQTYFDLKELSSEFEGLRAQHNIGVIITCEERPTPFGPLVRSR